MIELMLFRIVSVALLILANGFFVAAEFALVSVRETRIERILLVVVTYHSPGIRIIRCEMDIQTVHPAVS